MSFTSWLRNLRSAVAPGRTPGSRPRQRSLRLTTHRPGLEVLEDRYLPSPFTVLNLLDSGAGSLRDAVAAANANPGADAIDFATTGTITLTSGQLNITDSVTINGPGASALTVSGNHVSRVFWLYGNPTVSIADLTVANGRTSGWGGGGIYMAGGNLTLHRVAVSGNQGVQGAGRSIAGGTGYVNQSTVSGNYAGGVALYGVGGDGLGGGLYVAGGTLTLDHSTLSENTAYGAGGYTYPVGNF